MGKYPFVRLASFPSLSLAIYHWPVLQNELTNQLRHVIACVICYYCVHFIINFRFTIDSWLVSVHIYKALIWLRKMFDWKLYNHIRTLKYYLDGYLVKVKAHFNWNRIQKQENPIDCKLVYFWKLLFTFFSSNLIFVFIYNNGRTHQSI